MSPISSARFSDSELRQSLCEVLWGWPKALHKQDSGSDSNDDFRRRWSRLQRLFELHKETLDIYVATSSGSTVRAIGTIEDLCYLFEKFRQSPEKVRDDLVADIFGSRQDHPSLDDQERALNLAVKMAYMLNCSSEHRSPVWLEHGTHQIPWRGKQSFIEFFRQAFPTSDHPGLNVKPTESPIDMKRSLLAKKLKKHAGLQFRATDDLRQHLKLNHRTGTVDIFHPTAFIKEHLRLTKDCPKDLSVEDCLKKGALPRQLALEVLDSIQKVLFPHADSKSHAMLASLVSRSRFDPDCLRFESVSIRNAHEKDIDYHYFGSRLADLYEEYQNPTPRGRAAKWFERKSGARYVMMATLTGVIIAILLGIASLGASSYQAWVAYQAWKHPVSPN